MGELAAHAEIIALAVPSGAIDDVLRELGDAVEGKMLVDVTNALTKEYDLALGFTTSGCAGR